MGMMGWGMGLWMGLGGLLLLALVVVAVLSAVWLAREIAGRGRGPASIPPTAREVLLRRYAAGEVDDDELARRMARLDQ